ncbi:MAG: histidinol-phosphatase HisJ family protein [Chloroflexi bacterium]|nr:histidinol-phosphatase HisJ family protein [Chloroflexota bacterium]
MSLSNYIGDYHIHTRFSSDSDSEMTAVCESAIARGMREIAFTDHVDYGSDDILDYLQPVEYLAEIERCRARYGDRLTIRAGLEIGEPHVFAQEAAIMLAMGDFDFVIGSAHYATSLTSFSASMGVDGLLCAWKPDFFEQPLRQAYEAYFRQVVHLAAEGDFDVLGHLDLVKRDARNFDKPYDGPEPYADLIRTALRSIVERGKGIEINTSALYKGKGMDETCPTIEILRWYRELGGEILTFGSDSHTPDKVGAHFDVALEMARSVGFTRLAGFEKRKVQWNRM